jgi:hypothetical protein
MRWILWYLILVALCGLPTLTPGSGELPAKTPAELAAILNATAGGLAPVMSWASANPWEALAAILSPGLIALLRRYGVLRALGTIGMHFAGWASVSVGYIGPGLFLIGTAWYLALAGRGRAPAVPGDNLALRQLAAAISHRVHRRRR